MEIINNQDISYLDKILLNEKGLLIVKDAKIYKNIPIDHLALFGHNHGLYCFPTTELIDWILNLTFFDKSKAIEIGAGQGALGRALGITLTDSKLQNRPKIKAAYEIAKQPTIKYPPDVKRKAALKAIEKYKPEIIVGSWITHKYDETGWKPLNGGNLYGVTEEDILEKVKYYIFVGNFRVHKYKPIMSIPHTTYQYDWLYSRSMHREDDFIAIWEGKKND